MRVLFAAFLAVLSVVHADMLMEYTFVMYEKQTLDNDLKSGHVIAWLLNSTDVKSVRYHQPLVSGQPRYDSYMICQFVFPDFPAWVRWQTDHVKTVQHLWDFFWTQSRRTLYNIIDDPTFPRHKRSPGNVGGYMYQLHYAIKPGQESALASYLKTSSKPFTDNLDANLGFFEHRSMVDAFLDLDYPHMETFDFASLEAMTKSMKSSTYETFFAGMQRFLSKYTVTLYAPGHADGKIFFGKALKEH
eukprot:TRINITY_DN6566_c0_g1_i1.p1 TRINITY_DN6566_c0_g1~~TRINITY_DN6566_c0_g1_i1.p1  ORF type:complete len:245 (+),score=33.46 TRINITY_DN6566_c0_g1_i1:57-791(+)